MWRISPASRDKEEKEKFSGSWARLHHIERWQVDVSCIEPTAKAFLRSAMLGRGHRAAGPAGRGSH